jgi:hypothetical protein
MADSMANALPIQAATAIVIAMSFLMVIRLFISSPSVNKLVKSERIIRAHLVRRKQSTTSLSSIA